MTTNKPEARSVVRVTVIDEKELPAYVCLMDKEMRDWTRSAARGEVGWVCSDCCMSELSGMPDECFHGHQRCTEIIQRDKRHAMQAGNEPT